MITIENLSFLYLNRHLITLANCAGESVGEGVRVRVCLHVRESVSDRECECVKEICCMNLP